MHKHNHFLTLTYRESELTWGNTRATLVPEDLQKFFKRLRKYTNGGIRHFSCGEYGDDLGRPHYHSCVFGLDIKDKKYHTTKNGHNLYKSDTLNGLWTHGDVRIGSVTFESAAYVARYIMKKQLGKNAGYYDEEGIYPEFARMSNGGGKAPDGTKLGGIGKSWLDKYMTDVFPLDSVICRNGIKTRPPRYYSNQLELKNPQLYEAIKAQRKKSIENQPEEEFTRKRLEVRERVKAAQIKNLKRSL